jgi:hypothetical protein
MKGLIFNEFLGYVEGSMSYDMVDKILLSCELESGGAYTSIGTYDHHELFCLIDALGKEVNKPSCQILEEFGEYLFTVFVNKYPQFFRKKVSTFHFLSRVETHIHVEVKKFYQDVDLPHFRTKSPNPSQLILTYVSSRPLADFAEGLLKGCIRYHAEDIAVIRKDLPVKQGSKSQFILTKQDLK